MNSVLSTQARSSKKNIISHWPQIWSLFAIYFLLCGLTILQSSSTYHKFFYFFAIPPSLYILAKRKIAEYLNNPIILLYLIFVVSAIISTIINKPDETGTAATRSIYIFSLFLTASIIIKESKQQALYAALLAGATVLAVTLYHFMPLITTLDPKTIISTRFIGSGSLDNPLLSSHLFGFYTVLFTSAAIYTKKTKAKLLLSLPALCFLIFTLSTGSRTPLLALFSVVLWLPIINPNKKTIGILLAFALCLLLTYFKLPELILNRGLSYRPELWSLAIEQIKAAPYFGYGFNADTSFYIRSLNTGFSEPHNIHISIAYFTGIIGFSIWAGMHAIAVYLCIKNRSNPIFSVASCLLIYGIAAGMTEGGGLLPRPKEHWFITWIPLALVSALASRKKICTVTQT